MRIINKANGRETSVTCAVDIVTDGDGTVHRGLQQMVTRLLEELITGDALTHRQISRILAYKFEVTED